MDKIWRPDIILYNNADADQHYNSQLTSTNAILSNEGNVTWLSSAIFKSSCEINVEYFPFDEQESNHQISDKKFLYKSHFSYVR